MWLLLLGTVFAISYYYLREKMRHFEKLGVPHVKPWIIIGNMGPILLRQKSFPDLVRDYYDKFKGERYFGFYTFMTPMIIVRDPELIKNISIKNFDNFTDHMPFMNEETDKVVSQNIFQLRGDKWRESRAILSPAFTGSKMRGIFNLVNSTADNFKKFLTSRANFNDKDIDMKDAFGRYTVDVIANAAFGIEVNSLLNKDNGFYEMSKQTVDLDGWKSVIYFLNRMFPSLVKLLNLRMFNEKTEKFFIDLVKTNVETREKHHINRRDMLQLMIQSNNESKTTKLTVNDMAAQAFVFFFAGYDSTASSTCFAAHEIANNPLVQRKLAREVRDNYSKIMDKENGYDEVRGLNYLDAVIKESLRIHSPAFLMDRVCTQAFKLPPAHPGAKDVMVQRGDAIGFPFQAIHLDREYFSEPHKFLPERFLRQDGTVAKEMIESGPYMPFGLGPRMCIGNRFALMEVKLVLLHLLASCELFPSSKTAYPVKYSKTSSQMTAENGFWLKLRMINNETDDV